MHFFFFFLLDKKPAKEWPTNGEIIFKNLYLRYGAETPFVLNNLNVKIESMEKVTREI